MPTTVSFTYEDAVDALVKFHCLPDSTTVEIQPSLEGLGEYDKFLNHLISISVTNDKWSSKIPAIKEVRNKVGLGLKEAKNVMDDLSLNKPSVVNAQDLKDALDKFGVTL